MASRKLIVEIVGDSRSLDRAFKKSSNAAEGFGHKMKRIGIGVGVALGAAAISAGGLAIAFGVKAVKSAMSLQQSIRRVNVVFGKSAPAIRNWGSNAALALGLTEDKALEGAGAIGLLLRNMDFAPKKSAGMSKKMVQLAVDMAALSKASPDDTLKALQRGLGGMMRGLKQYGIVLSAATVKSEAMRETGIKDAKQLTDGQLAQARYNLILKRSALAQGFFAKHAKTLPELFKIIGAELHNLKDQFGIGLLPVVRKVAIVLATKLADPKFRLFVQQLGHEVGVTLVNAFTKISTWFVKHWPQILAFLRTTAAVLRHIAHWTQMTIQGLDKITKFAGHFGFIKTGIGGAIGAVKGASNFSAGLVGGGFHKDQGGLHVHGDVHVHGVQNPAQMYDQIHRVAKRKTKQTRGRHQPGLAHH